MKKWVAVLVTAVVATGAVYGASAIQKKPKHTIKDVMGKAHKGGLLKEVMKGKASKEDKMKLLEMYVALSENKPPKGDPKSWGSKTDALIVAAAKELLGSGPGEAAWKKAASCGGCHKAHK